MLGRPSEVPHPNPTPGPVVRIIWSLNTVAGWRDDHSADSYVPGVTDFPMPRWTNPTHHFRGVRGAGEDFGHGSLDQAGVRMPRGLQADIQL